MFSPKRTIACWEATDEITSGFQAQANDLGFVFKFQQSWEENVNFEGKPGNVSSHAATTTSRPETVAQNPDEARMRDVSTSSWIFLSTMQICIALLSCSCCRGAVCGDCFPWLQLCPSLAGLGLVWRKGQLTLVSSEVRTAGVSLRLFT